MCQTYEQYAKLPPQLSTHGTSSITHYFLNDTGNSINTTISDPNSSTHHLLKLITLYVDNVNNFQRLRTVRRHITSINLSMRTFLLASTLLLCQLATAQKLSPGPLTVDNFDDIIFSYEPTRKSGLDEAKYSNGIFFLERTREAIASDNGRVSYADYFNICMALIQLEESEELIALGFQRAIDKDPTSMCVLVAKKTGRLDKIIPEQFYSFLQQCKDLPPTAEFDLEDYTATHEVDPALVEIVHAMDQRDKKYRSGKTTDWSTQRPLDEQNQRIVDSLFEVYGSYVGSSLVGEPMSSTMWLVIQHSTISMMERYLPHMLRAHEEGNLVGTAITMTIDRIYAHKEGYQIYGSQQGVDLAPETVRKEIRELYGL